MNSRPHNRWLRALALDTALSRHARLVAVQVATEFAADGKCDVSYTAMANACAMSRAAAVQAMRELTDRGWLDKVATQAKGTNSYQLTLGNRFKQNLRTVRDSPL